MPLEIASFVSGLDPTNPDNLTDYVSQGDDHLRLIKTTLTQTFPNMSSAVTYSSAELNDLRTNVTHTGTSFTFNSNTLSGVTSKNDDTAVEPRLYNDGRYVRPDVAVATTLLLNNTAPINTKDFGGTTRNLISQSAADLVVVGTTNASGINLVNSNVQVNGTHIIDLIYPVGTIYENGSVSTNPGTLFGRGTWIAYGAGRFTIGQRDIALAPSSPYDLHTVGNQGGAESRTLTLENIPNHTHNMTATNQTAGSSSGFDIDVTCNTATTATGNVSGYSGSQVATQMMPPYKVVYRWIRTA